MHLAVGIRVEHTYIADEVRAVIEKLRVIEHQHGLHHLEVAVEGFKHGRVLGRLHQVVVEVCREQLAFLHAYPAVGILIGQADDVYLAAQLVMEGDEAHLVECLLILHHSPSACRIVPY